MMEGNDKVLYSAFKMKDPRVDGRFFVGVRSTGIYCRPICRARLPKPENCTYFSTAAEAERAGFRPCLLCRPELAPGYAPVDAAVSLAHRAARVLEENCSNEANLEQLASRMGCTGRHLRRAFTAEYHVSPSQYLRTCRLLLAKSLLTDTNLSILDVAMTSGFNSLRRFNDAFRKQYRLTPTALRKQARNGEECKGQDITILLGYRPPYGWDQLLDFLAVRAIPGVEVVENQAYCRTVRLAAEEKSFFGWILVKNRPDKNALQATISTSLLSVLPRVLSRIRHLFDLYCDPSIIDESLSVMNQLKPGLFIPGTRLPGCFDAYEMAVRAVLGQQISVKAASTLAGRLAQTCGLPINTGIKGLTHVFPAAKDILALKDPVADQLGPLGITSSRSKTIRALAEALEEGGLDLCFSPEPQREMEKLLAIPGIGPWTVQYLAMRVLGWTDAFPHSDYGIKKALAPRSDKDILDLAETWRPWRSYAAINLWNSL